MHPYHILGATVEPVLVIRVRNPAALAAKRGGVAGGAAGWLVPQTTSGLVYGELKKAISDGLKKEDVDADVTIMSLDSLGPQPKTDFLGGVAVGAGGVGVAYLLWRFLLSRFFGGRK